MQDHQIISDHHPEMFPQGQQDVQGHQVHIVHDQNPPEIHAQGDNQIISDHQPEMHLQGQPNEAQGQPQGHVDPGQSQQESLQNQIHGDQRLEPQQQHQKNPNQPDPNAVPLPQPDA